MNPLHQFTVKTLVPIDLNGANLSFTNSSLFMVLSVLLGSTLLWLLIRHRALVPATGQSIVEALFGFIKSTAKDSIGAGYEAYLPFIFSVKGFEADMLSCSLSKDIRSYGMIVE